MADQPLEPEPRLVALKAANKWSSYYVRDRRYEAGESGIIHAEPRHVAALIKQGCEPIEET